MRKARLKFGIGVAMALTAALGMAQTSPRGTDLKTRAEAATRPFAPTIEWHADTYGVDPALVAAVITIESNGNPNAMSSAGAMGLMQLMPDTCFDFGVNDPFAPNENIRGGTALLAKHLRRYQGDLSKVLAAYNAGPRRVDDGTWTNIAETRRYVPAVLAVYAALHPGGTGVIPPPLLPYQPPKAGPSFQDTMFETVRTSNVISDPIALAENGALSDAADMAMSDVVAGKVTSKNLAKRVVNLLNKNGTRTKSVRAYLLSTSDADGFAAEWAKQTPAPGRFIGLSHSVRKGTHLWIVILADL